jgi:hypothetical protein
MAKNGTKKAPAGHEYICFDKEHVTYDDVVGRGTTAKQARDRAASILCDRMARDARRYPSSHPHYAIRKRKLLKRIKTAEVAIVPIGTKVDWYGRVTRAHQHRTECKVCVVPKSYSL